MNAALFEDREDPGRKASAALAVAVHVALAILLVYGIRWQTRSPEAVEVELVRALPARAPAAVAPPEPEPAPPPKIEPKPEPRPEPKPAPPAKPDIALKEQEKPKPKPEPKPVPKAEPKPKPNKVDPMLDRELKDLEAQRRKQMAARELEQLKSDQAAVARSKATAEYIGKIKGKIKGNIVLPPDIRGNPEAIFDVVQPAAEARAGRTVQPQPGTEVPAAGGLMKTQFQRRLTCESRLSVAAVAKMYNFEITHSAQR